MGNNPLQHSEQDSISEPGHRSIISGEIPVGFKEFCDRAMEIARYPVFDPLTEATLKEVLIAEDTGPDDIDVRVILDGAKIGQLDPSGKGRDFVMLHVKTKCKRAERTFVQSDYAPYFIGDEEGGLTGTNKTVFLTDPFRMEYWKILPDGSRYVDGGCMLGLDAYITRLMEEFHDKPVRVRLDKDKKAFTTGPIEETIVSYDGLFEGVMITLKEFPPPTIEEITYTKTKLTYGENPEENPYTMLEHDKDKGSIILSGWNPDGSQKLNSVSYTFTQSPLELNIVPRDWEGTVLLGQVSMRVVQTQLDKFLSNAPEAGSWFSGF